MLVAALFVVGLYGCCSVRPPRNAKPTARYVWTTGYCKCGKCCGWRRTWYGKPVFASGPNKGKRKRVGITASGTRARAGITIAADPRVFPFGTIIHVPGWGYGRVEDTGGSIIGEHIDLFFGTHAQALAWGRQRLRVKVWKPTRE